MDAALPLVIVGAGLAGWTTAREFRKLDTTTPVQLVTADSGDFYAKPTLSNAFGQKRSPEQLVTTVAADMAANLQVQLHAHTTVQSIDTAARTLELVQTGAVQTLAYRQLVLATGAPQRSVRPLWMASLKLLSLSPTKTAACASTSWSKSAPLHVAPR
jgi:rubredoxin-NAD+ reductase